MSIVFNKSRRWQLPGGFELHSGDQVELFLEGEWRTGVINLRPRDRYQVCLEDGRALDLSEGLVLRIHNREYRALQRGRAETEP